MREHILVVEDDPMIRRILRRLLERDGYQVVEASTVAEAMEQHVDPVLVVMDFDLPDGNSDQLVPRLKHAGYTGKYLCVTGESGEARRALSRFDDVTVIAKPFDLPKIMGVIEGLLRR